MNKDSKTLTKIFNMADKMGLYCLMTKAHGEVLDIHVGKQSFFSSSVATDSIHNSDGHRYSYRDLKRYVYNCKE